MDKKTFEGPITITRSGKGFFSPPVPDGVKSDRANDLLIPREWLGTALPGDRVKVEAAGMVDRRKAGRVTEIVSRGRERWVGTLAKTERGNVILIPDSKRMYVPFLIQKHDEAKFPLGHKVVVKFITWDPAEEIPRAEVVEDIGIAGEHETEMRALALAQGFSAEFPPGVATEAKQLEVSGKALIEAGTAGRWDFRAIPTFTIDPADAKDFDDALSVRTLPDGKYEIGVHIADVSYFVTPGTAIDKEARARATSVYLVDRTIPMLPHVLSTDLCSLNPDVDRLSVSAVFTIDAEANVHEKWFGETVIHSAKRFTYEEAQAILDAASAASSRPTDSVNRSRGVLEEELLILRDLARKIRAKRVAKGAIEFDTKEIKVELDENKKPVAIRLKDRQETNLLIEDFMLLANEAVAEFLAAHTKKSRLMGSMVYRVHDAPDAERILDLAQFLKVMGYTLPNAAGRVKGTDINRLLEEVKGKPEEYLIKTAALRSMAKAVYATKNAGHFGLAFDYYTHFTSPIRRYPDLMVHRMLKHYEHDKKLSDKELHEYEELALHSSEREVAAAEAERDSVKLKIVEFMADKIGQEFDAVISGVSDRGVYVELKDTHAEGMIRLRDLGDDYYIYDEKRYRIVGERTKTQFALGDLIRVKLTAARAFERELDFTLVAQK